MATQERPLDGPRRTGAQEREASVAGSLSDMGVADLVQTLEMGKKSGVLHLKSRTGARATCHFREGRVVDCELGGALQGEEAFFRILRWSQGGFAIEFKPSEREERIQLPTQALLLQGMRRIDEWRRALEQLPPLERTLEVDVSRLGERLAKIPDGANALLRLFDGRRTLAQVIDLAPGGELAAADTISRLVGDGILTDPSSHASPAPAGALPHPEPHAPPSWPAAAPEPGGVDWFAGPVGPEAAVTPVASWVLTADGTEPAPMPTGGDWLEPPLPGPEPAFALPAPTSRAAPARSAARFSIPVPPPGTLPPPPSIAETLARHRAASRPARTPVPAPRADAPAPVPSQLEPDGEQVSPSARSGAEPAQVPQLPAGTQATESATEEVAIPAAQEQAAAPVAHAHVPGDGAQESLVPARGVAPPVEQVPGMVPPRTGTDAPASGSTTPAEKRPRPFQPGALPLNLGAPPPHARPPSAPARRSVLPYVVVVAFVIAGLAAGVVLTRRPPLDGAPVVAMANPEPTATAERSEPSASAERPEPAAVPPGAAPEAAEAAPDAGRAPSAAAAAAVAPSAAAPAEERPRPEAPLPAGPAPEDAVAARESAVAHEPAPARTVPATPSPSPETAAPVEEVDVRKMLAAADRKYRAGRYAEAITAYRRAVALRPTLAARIALARALYDGNRSDEALRELDAVIADDPRDASAWLLRGDIHQGEGRTDEARQAYQRFLELEPRGEQAQVVRTILEREAE